MKKWVIGFVVTFLLTGCSPRPASVHERGFPSQWTATGIGGGGAFFGPSFNPNNPNDIFVNSDMSGLFRSTDGGASWKMLNFRYIRGHDKMAPVQFASDPNILYGLNGEYLVKSVDGGVTWNNVPAASALWIVYGVFADLSNPARLCFSDDTSIYFSSDGASTAKVVYKTNSIHMAGAYFDCNNIFIATSAGLLVSTDNGNSFYKSNIVGIPSGEAIVSFAGSKQNGTLRFFCATWNSAAVYPGMSGHYPDSYKSVYRTEYQPLAWNKVTNGLSGWVSFVSMCPTNNSIVYAAGSSSDGWYPAVFKSTNGGNSWASILSITQNRNIFTGWMGDTISDPQEYSWQQWDWGASIIGFGVCASDPQRAIMTDFGFVHITTNGGKTWSAVYVSPSSLNPTNQMVQHGRSYMGVGLEPTACYSLLWMDKTNIFESVTDIHGTRSTDGGITWSFPTGLIFNTSYEAIKHPTNKSFYAAVSEVHNIYMNRDYTMDENIEWGGGTVACSKNNGASWTHLPNFNYPVVSLAVDTKNYSKMYISGVNRAKGGIFVSANYQSGNPTWTKLGSPGRTQGHPYVIRVLKDGTLVCSYSARFDGTDFTASSGVYVSTNGGKAWMDRTHTGMKYYTADVVIDPNDANQNVWYAGVCKDESSSRGTPGLYRTTNRGVSWTKISKNIENVWSCAVAPGNPNVLYLTTRWEGLWYTTNARASSPLFYQVSSYPFKHPTRVFFNPYNTNEIWVTSFGGGVMIGDVTTATRNPFIITEKARARPSEGLKANRLYRGHPKEQ